MGENPDCLLLSGTVVGENPDHVCWVQLQSGLKEWMPAYYIHYILNVLKSLYGNSENCRSALPCGTLPMADGPIHFIFYHTHHVYKG